MTFKELSECMGLKIEETDFDKRLNKYLYDWTMAQREEEVYKEYCAEEFERLRNLKNDAIKY